MFWAVEYMREGVWVVMGFWYEGPAIVRIWTYRTRNEAIAATNKLRCGRPGRYRLGRSSQHPKPQS